MFSVFEFEPITASAEALGKEKDKPIAVRAVDVVVANGAIDDNTASVISLMIRIYLTFYYCE